jgi:hypothetical protein
VPAPRRQVILESPFHPASAQPNARGIRSGSPAGAPPNPLGPSVPHDAECRLVLVVGKRSQRPRFRRPPRFSPARSLK